MNWKIFIGCIVGAVVAKVFCHFVPETIYGFELHFGIIFATGITTGQVCGGVRDTEEQSSA